MALSGFNSCSLLCSTSQKTSDLSFDVHSRRLCRASRRASSLTPPSMKHITAQQKHDILIHVRDRRGNEQPEEIAARHGVAAGRSTVYSWLQQWDGTPRSLERKAGSGKQRTLSAAEVQRHVRAPILAANRAARAVHYPSLLASVRQKTGKPVSIQTLRRYGKEELGAKQRRGKKRTADESQCTRT